MTDATATDRTERCDVCRSWQAANPVTGTCHRHAPRPAETRTTHWPRTLANDWCSEFKLHEAPAPPLRQP